MAYSSFIAHIGEATITYDKIQDVSVSDALLGRYSSGAGPVQEIPIGTGLYLASNTLSVLRGNLEATGIDGITVMGGTGAVIGSGANISQQVADTTHNGYLSSVDWNNFNSHNLVDDSTTPSNTVTPVGYAKITVNGVDSWLPYYQ